jgi:hypothetical protein
VRDVQRLAVVVGVVVFVATRLDAQRRGGAAPLDPPRLGPHLGYNFDAAALSLGLQATLPLTYQVEMYPTFDYYFVSSPGSLWALNLDVKIRPRTPRRALYVGGGLDYLHSSNGVASSGDVNFSLIGGWEVRRSPVAPYVEGRLLLGHGSAFQVAGGLSFYLH